MVSTGNEGEKFPMSPEKVMSTLCGMKEIVEYLYQWVQWDGEDESSVHIEGGGEGGGFSGPSSPPSSSSYTNGASETSSKNKHS